MPDSPTLTHIVVEGQATAWPYPPGADDSAVHVRPPSVVSMYSSLPSVVRQVVTVGQETAVSSPPRNAWGLTAQVEPASVVSTITSELSTFGADGVWC